MMKTCFLTAFVFFLLHPTYGQRQPSPIDLSGEWAFRIDSLDVGEKEKWFQSTLTDKIFLPGSMTTNLKGNDVTIKTQWTGHFDSSFYKSPEYARYRKPGNIKIPFWLTPVKYYKGAAWYQKEIIIPVAWKGYVPELFIERSHWETTVWVDGTHIGMDNSLGTPHVFSLPLLSAGPHTITIRIDNRVKDIEVGLNSHSISDHTQGNWNGMIGKLLVSARPTIGLENVRTYPDVKGKQVRVVIEVKNLTGKKQRAQTSLWASVKSAGDLATVSKDVELDNGTSQIEIVYPMGENAFLWDEFNPNLYELHIQLSQKKKNVDARNVTFGMRDFSANKTQFAINGRPIFLRGTLECAIFPETGYPPMEEKAWERIFNICRSYGLNHIRFHSWTPPEAAFNVADRLGFYLQVECGSWANSWVKEGSALGDGKPIDKYLYGETQRIISAYGNHPSFCMMAYGNEPRGENHVKYLRDYVLYWKAKEPGRLYTTGSGWPIIEESDYNSTFAPRIQDWGAGLKSVINSEPPRTDYDWRTIIKDYKNPTVSHEIGEWCVYPDLKEIKRYTGVLRAKNFEIFADKLQQNGLLHLADSFLLASGKLQTLCYKADIEAALRTPGFAGFQLLDLHDFPGQGTALVGVLNPFWESKGYVTPEEYRAFCNTTVPLVRFPKMIYSTSDILKVPVEVAHFGKESLTAVTPKWKIIDDKGIVLFNGALSNADIPVGNNIQLGVVTQPLKNIKVPAQLKLSVEIGAFENSWDFFVYNTPEKTKDDILVTHQLDAKANEVLSKGGKVLLSLPKGVVKPDWSGNIALGFSSIFWNTAWTSGQAPHTLGILCNPAHPAFTHFPTQYHSNWQWWDAITNADVMMLDKISPGLKPLIRVIDDWVTARSIGLAFECKVGNGKLLVTSIDLLEDQQNRLEANQLMFSLRNYMAGADFNPDLAIAVERIEAIINQEKLSNNAGVK